MSPTETSVVPVHALPRCGYTIKAVLLTGVVSGLMLLTACASQSAEDQVRARLAELVSAIEARDRRGVNEFLAPGFVAQSQGRAVDPHLLMLAYFRQVKQIRIQTYAVEVAVTDDTALVRLNAVVMGGQGWLPERVNVYEVSSEWVRRDSDVWQVSRAGWQRLEVSGEDLPADIKRVLGL